MEPKIDFGWIEAVKKYVSKYKGRKKERIRHMLQNEKFARHDHDKQSVRYKYYEL